MPNVIQFLRELFVNEACFVCAKAVQLPYSICPDCLSSMEINHTCCSICASPLVQQAQSNIICGHCQRNRPFFSKAHVPYLYQAPLKQLIWQFKYQQKLFLARDFAMAIRESLKDSSELPDILLPVPLHNNKLCRRGYNQSHELARMLGQQLNIPVLNDCLVRHIDTQSQQGLKLKERQKNVKNAFAITKNSDFKDKHIVLVDDVMTTGSTLNELARLMVKQSNARVDVWCIARA